MQKIINLEAQTVNDKIDVICRLISITAKPEVLVIKSLYNISSGGPCAFPTYDRHLICISTKTNINTFNVSLNRLIKKGVITQVGVTFMLHPVFKDINLYRHLTIDFVNFDTKN